MGGGGGGPRSIGNVRGLIDKAKDELRKGEQEGKRNVFISFSYEDIDKVNLLRGQAKNENSPIEFNDWSVSVPINSERAPYIKQKIAERIERSSATVVYLSSKTLKSDWVRWEVEESLARGKNVIGVYPQDKKPRQLPEVIRSNKIKCVSWPELAGAIDSLGKRK